MATTTRTASSRRRKLFLFTKPAVPGRVKTRLVGDLTAEQTARLHAAFLNDVSRELEQGELELEIAWALDEDRPVPPGIESRPYPGLRQVGADLGERLFNVLRDGAVDGASVAALGSDHPEISHRAVENAFEMLEAGADVVLGPTPDGGYFLIALAPQAVHRRLFEDVAWSTDAVRTTTLERCRELELRVELLPMGHDVDFPEDLAALVERLRQAPSSVCVDTRRCLRELGMETLGMETPADEVRR